MRYSISVIIPTYNEEGLLKTSVPKIDNFLKERFENYEIIIVESGSTDNSGVICDQFAKDKSNISVIHEGRRNGIGSAIQIGYAKATKDLVWVIVADIPFPLEAIDKALPLLDKYDCVLSYRSQDPRGFKRKFMSWIYNSLVKNLLGLKIKNFNSAFKVCKTKIIKTLPLKSPGWFYDAELVYYITKRGIKYTEIPVPIVEQSSRKSFVKLSTSLGMIKELIEFIKNRQ